MKKTMLKYFLCLVCLMTEFTAFCQDFPTDDEDGDLQADDAAPVPINGRIIWLVAAGVLFAYYKVRNQRAKEVIN
jgi:hypothetical protein